MRPSLGIVLVVIRIPYGCASDLVGEVFVRTELVVQWRMLARGLDTIRKNGAGQLFFNGRCMVWIIGRQPWCHNWMGDWSDEDNVEADDGREKEWQWMEW